MYQKEERKYRNWSDHRAIQEIREIVSQVHIDVQGEFAPQKKRCRDQNGRCSLQIVFWDEKGIFMEHRFISPVDNFINAIVLTRTRLLNCNVEEVMDELLVQGSDTESQKKIKPEMPPEIEKWLECNAISSAKLRTN